MENFESSCVCLFFVLDLTSPYYLSIGYTICHGYIMVCCLISFTCGYLTQYNTIATFPEFVCILGGVLEDKAFALSTSYF